MRTYVVAAVCALCVPALGGEMTNETKTVLALQCFLNAEEEQRIIEVWKQALTVEGVKCAYTLGAVPHITAGSWKVTPEELEEARTGLAEAVAAFEPIGVDVTLHEDRRNEVYSYYLVPTNAEAFVAFHAALHEALGYPYETFREIDLPGQWWPHLTLFSVPESNRASGADALDELGKIGRVRVERVGLVTFGPIEVVAEAPLASKAEQRAVYVTEVAAGVEDVWRAFTTKDGLEAWMAPRVEIDFKVGGLMKSNYNPKGRIGDASTIENTILAYDPQRMLGLKATKYPEGFPFVEAAAATWTVFYFDETEPGRTKITVVGLGYTDSEQSQQMRSFFAQANAQSLDKLKALLEEPGGRRGDGY